MNNQSLTLVSLLILGCISALIISQFVPSFWNLTTETYSTYDGTRGSAVEHKGKLWTLNFDQQRELISSLDRGHEIGYELIKKDASLFPYNKIVIYQFGKPDIVFTPINYQNGDIVFSAPEILENGYLLAGGSSKLKDLLSQSFDQ